MKDDILRALELIKKDEELQQKLKEVLDLVRPVKIRIEPRKKT